MIHFWPITVRIIIAILLSHVCVVETLDFSGIKMDLQVRKNCFCKFLSHKNMKWDDEHSCLFKLISNLRLFKMFIIYKIYSMQH